MRFWFFYPSFSALLLLQSSKAWGKGWPQPRKGSTMDLLGGLGPALSISGPPCSREHKGTAQGECSSTILRIHDQSFFHRHPFSEDPLRPLCPKAPRPCPLTCHARACLTPCFVCTVVCRLSGWRVGAAGQSYINKADLGTLLGESEIKRRRGPFHSGSDTYEIRSHPVIALVCTLKVASVGVASVRRPSKFSVGETEAKKNHKPDKEQRKKERKVRGN